MTAVARCTLTVLVALVVLPAVLHGQSVRVDSTYDRFEDKTTITLVSDWMQTTNPSVAAAFYYRATPPCRNMGSNAVRYTYCGANLILFRHRTATATRDGRVFNAGCIEMLIDEYRRRHCGGGIGAMRHSGRDSSGRYVSIRSIPIDEGRSELSQLLTDFQSAEFRLGTVEWSLPQAAIATYRKWAAEVELRDRRYKPWLFSPDNNQR